MQRKLNLSERTNKLIPYSALAIYSFKNSISTLVNSMDPDQLASLANSVDPDQLASKEAS